MSSQGALVNWNVQHPFILWTRHYPTLNILQQTQLQPTVHWKSKQKAICVNMTFIGLQCIIVEEKNKVNRCIQDVVKNMLGLSRV